MAFGTAGLVSRALDVCPRPARSLLVRLRMPRRRSDKFEEHDVRIWRQMMRLPRFLQFVSYSSGRPESGRLAIIVSGGPRRDDEPVRVCIVSHAARTQFRRSHDP